MSAEVTTPRELVSSALKTLREQTDLAFAKIDALIADQEQVIASSVTATERVAEQAKDEIHRLGDQNAYLTAFVDQLTKKFDALWNAVGEAKTLCDTDAIKAQTVLLNAQGEVLRINFEFSSTHQPTNEH